jgi:hypothetical protein
MSETFERKALGPKMGRRVLVISPLAGPFWGSSLSWAGRALMSTELVFPFVYPPPSCARPHPTDRENQFIKSLLGNN